MMHITCHHCLITSTSHDTADDGQWRAPFDCGLSFSPFLLPFPPLFCYSLFLGIMCLLNMHARQLDHARHAHTTSHSTHTHTHTTLILSTISLFFMYSLLFFSHTLLRPLPLPFTPRRLAICANYRCLITNSCCRLAGAAKVANGRRRHPFESIASVAKHNAPPSYFILCNGRVSQSCTAPCRKKMLQWYVYKAGKLKFSKDTHNRREIGKRITQTRDAVQSLFSR